MHCLLFGVSIGNKRCTERSAQPTMTSQCPSYELESASRIRVSSFRKIDKQGSSQRESAQ